MLSVIVGAVVPVKVTSRMPEQPYNGLLYILVRPLPNTIEVRPDIL